MIWINTKYWKSTVRSAKFDFGTIFFNIKLKNTFLHFIVSYLKVLQKIVKLRPKHFVFTQMPH